MTSLNDIRAWNHYLQSCAHDSARIRRVVALMDTIGVKHDHTTGALLGQDPTLLRRLSEAPAPQSTLAGGDPAEPPGLPLAAPQRLGQWSTLISNQHDWRVAGRLIQFIQEIGLTPAVGVYNVVLGRILADATMKPSSRHRAAMHINDLMDAAGVIADAYTIVLAICSYCQVGSAEQAHAILHEELTDRQSTLSSEVLDLLNINFAGTTYAEAYRRWRAAGDAPQDRRTPP